MTTPLHTIHDLDALTACLARSGKQDCLLLLEDAVYAALATHPQAPSLAGRQIHVLTEDLTARGLNDSLLADGIRAIDMIGFVALTAFHHPTVGWFR